MTHFAWWRDNRRIILQLSLFAVCCCLAVWIRALVAADTLSDLTSVTIQTAAVLGFIAAAAVALPAGRHARNVVERVALRTVPIGVLIVAGMFVKTSYADVSVALHALTTKSDGSQTVIALGPGGRDIRLTGSLTEGAASKLAELLDSHPHVERIHLTSDGGLADEGEALRKVIAAHKLTTFVPDYCVSACTLAFLGGRSRLVMDGARLGFHAPYEEGLFNQTFAGDGTSERTAYLVSGVAADFVDRAFKVKPEDIWTPPASQLLAAHVATGVVDRYRFPDSNLDGVATKSGAHATLLSNFPLARAIEKDKPEAVDVIAAWYLDAYRRGMSEGEIVDEVTSILGHAASIALASADDQTVIGFGRYVAQAMEAAENEDACVSIGANPSLVEAETVLSEDDDKADEQAVAILSRALTSRHLRGAASQEQERVEASTAELRDEDQPCSRLRGAYAQVLRQPSHTAAAAFRALLTPSEETPVSAEVAGVLSH